MARESIKSLRKIAEQSGYAHWCDYLYDYCLNGNSLKNICDNMTRRDVLDIIDVIVSMMLNEHQVCWDKEVLRKMYIYAYNSLSARL